MTEFFQTLQTYFSFSFVQYGFIAGIMIAAASSLLGVILVLKRFSYIGDGLSHTAFGAMAIASILNSEKNLFQSKQRFERCIQRSGRHIRRFSR